MPVASNIILTEAQTTYAGVASAPNLAAKLFTFAVTGVTVAEVDTVLALGVANTVMSISGTPANVQSDLALGASSVILDNTAGISAITPPLGSTITLIVARATYAGVTTVLNTISNLSAFEVTEVTLAQIATVSAPGVANTLITVNDSAANVRSDVALGAPSVIQKNASEIGAINLQASSSITLTEARAPFAASRMERCYRD